MEGTCGTDSLDAPSAAPTPRTGGAIRTWRSTPILQYSNTPSLRAAGFEDEDENEAPCEGSRDLDGYQGLKPLAESFHPFGISRTPPLGTSLPASSPSETPSQVRTLPLSSCHLQ